MKLRPRFSGGYFQLAVMLAGQGRRLEAVQEMKRMRIQLSSNWTGEDFDGFLGLNLRHMPPERADHLQALVREAWAESGMGA